jgi:copper transport protein
MLRPTLLRLLGLALVLLALLPAPAALAHAEFRGSDPAADALLDTLPPLVTLEFSEQVGILALAWRLPDLTEVAAEAQAGAQSVSVTSPPDAGTGTYVLRWRVASTDGHPVAGSLVFSIGQVSGAEGAKADSRSARLVVTSRAAMVVALVLSVGVAVFHALFAPVPQAARQWAVAGAVLMPPLGLLWFGAEGLDRLGLPPGSLALPGVWAEAWLTPARFSVGLGVAAALVALPALRAARGLALLAWALVAASFTVSGHALSAPTRAAVPLTFLHGAALLFWVGGLLPLAAALAGLDGPARAALLRRFSGPAAVAVLVLAGSGAGLILIRPLGLATLATPWAQLLAAKLVLVAAMLALAVWHRARAIPRLARGQSAPVRPTIRIEAALGIAVLCLAMGFRLAPPPSAMAVDLPSVHLHGPNAMADIFPSAVPPGAVGLQIYLADGDLNPLDPQEVRLSLTDPVAGIGPLNVTAAQQKPGLWTTAPLTLPSPGPWQIQLVLLVTDFSQVTLTGTLPESP